MQGKRPYRLGKRQASVDQTRRRILAAAVAEYAQHGLEDTTMLAVAKRADVASGTVLYHYPKPEDLADAVVDMWMEEADLPDTPDVPESLTLQERADLLVETVFEMYDDDHPAARIYPRSPEHPAMRRLLRFWDDELNTMIGSILGDYLDEADRPLIAAIFGGQFLANLGRRGIQGDELRRAVSRLTVAWLTSQPRR